VQGTPYSTTVHATGGALPYQWTVGTTTLVGLTIDVNSGVISGTPQNTGNFIFPVTVQDASGARYTVSFTLFIATQLSITTTSLPQGVPNVPYTPAVSGATTLQAGGGQGPYTWAITAGNLPAGLSLNASSGLISGTPTANGLFNFTAQVTDAGQRTATKQLSILIGQPLVITTTTLPDGTVGGTYSATLATTGGSTPVTWALASGSTLPQGLTLGSDTGVISGSPSAAGSFTVTITATDPNGSKDQKTYTFNIANPPVIVTSSVADGTVGLSYFQAFGASGGTPAYTWSIIAGSVPGLALDPTSAILIGKPTTAGAFNITVQVKDASGQTATKQYVVNIGPPLTITTGDLSGPYNVAFNQTLSTANGTAPYNWSVTTNNLPTGLSLNSSTGAITGTPIVPTSYVVTFSVTDGRQQTATKTITITITLPPTPPVSVTVTNTGGGAVGPAQQPQLAMSLGGSFPSEVNGVLTLRFAPRSGPDDPNVRFNNGLRTLNFIFRQGSTQAIFPSVNPGAVLTGTVAGTITLTATLRVGDTDITPAPAPTQTITINPGAPVITSVQLQNSGNGANIIVSGYTTTRDMVSGLFHFAVASGSTLQTSDFTVQLGPAFSTYFGTAASAATGGQFSLTVPFSGDTSKLVSVTVTLTNSVGNSAAVSP
jgi:hypothetical protein